MMAEDWKPGDLARCVEWPHDCAYPPDAPGTPIPGLTYTVIRVFVGIDVLFNRHLGLAFAEIERGISPLWHVKAEGYQARYFRKVRPMDADEFDREVIEAMNGQSVVVA